MLTEQFFQFVKKHICLILIHGIVIIAVHVSSPPQDLEHLPLFLDNFMCKDTENGTKKPSAKLGNRVPRVKV
jgi:hypothetical protein